MSIESEVNDSAMSANIDFNVVRSIVKKLEPVKFNGIIINENLNLARCNYQYIEYKLEVCERQLYELQSPAFPEFDVLFEDIENEASEYRTKREISNDDQLRLLRAWKGIEPSEKLNVKRKIINRHGLEEKYRIYVDDAFSFPMNIDRDEISYDQDSCIFPGATYKLDCYYCESAGYVACPDPECDGRHEFPCPNCKGLRKIDCNKCESTGHLKCQNCSGKGENKCSKCNGSGEIKCNNWITGCNGSGYIEKDGRQIRCPECSGRGYKVCTNCKSGFISCNVCYGKGEVRCDECHGHGEIDCPRCDAYGTVVCDTCHGDKEHYGQIDCPECLTQKAIHQVVYVDTVIKNCTGDLFHISGRDLVQDELLLRKHVNTEKVFLKTYHNLNGKISIEKIDVSQEVVQGIENVNGLNRNDFPLITKEEFYNQDIPVLEIEYRHVLTNTMHSLYLIDYNNKPELKFLSDPENLKQDLANVGKSFGSFIGKLLKTSKYQNKRDKINEIKLNIYLAAVDGDIHDEEKRHISELIGLAPDLTNVEKRSLFDLLASNTLQKLDAKDFEFSSREVAMRVVENLSKIAGSDTETSLAERDFIELVKKELGL